MITVRKSAARGHAQHGWLDSYHTFSFADYYDPKFMGFRGLRVINEDRVKGGEGFPTHPHRDMEILTYILSGSLEHRDSMGTGEVIHPGELQRMSAGTGVTHSEFNASATDPVHLLQIWILPARLGIPPSYEQVTLPAEKLAGLHLAAAPGSSGDDAVHIDADVRLYIGRLPGQESVQAQLAPGRYGWLQVARGSVAVNGVQLAPGDGAAISQETKLTIANDSATGNGAAEILLFDLA